MAGLMALEHDACRQPPRSRKWPNARTTRPRQDGTRRDLPTVQAPACPLAAALASDLERLNIRAWWDFDLYAGQDFHDAILTALDAAKAVIVIWSETAVRSPWVRDEATRASRQSKLVTTHVSTFDLANLPLGFGQRHSTDVRDRGAIVRALAKHGVVPQPEGARTNPERGRELIAKLRDMKAGRHARHNDPGVPSDAPDRTLGIDPKSKKQVTLRAGRFGPFVQLGTKSVEIR